MVRAIHDPEVHVVASNGMMQFHCRRVCGTSFPFGNILHVVHDTRMQPDLRFLYRMYRPVSILVIGRCPFYGCGYRDLPTMLSFLSPGWAKIRNGSLGGC